MNLHNGKGFGGALECVPVPIISTPWRGFTLVEVLVAMTLFVLVLTTIYSAFRGIMDANRRAEEVIENTQTARMILSDMSSRLASIYQLPASKEKERSVSAVGLAALTGGKSEESGQISLSFITNVDGRQVSAGIARGLGRVRYILKPTPISEQHGGASYSLIRETSTLGSPEWPGSPVEPVLLTDKVYSLGLRFLHPKTGEWQPAWGIVQEPPAAVAVDLVFDQAKTKSTRHDTFSLVVSLPKVTSVSELPPSRAPMPVGIQQAQQSKEGPTKPAPQITELKPQDPAKPRELPDAGTSILRK